MICTPWNALHSFDSPGQGADILVIEKVPMVVCPHCRQSFFTAEPLQELERLKLHQHNIAPQRTAPVIRYA